jgi:hypothetical protein
VPAELLKLRNEVQSLRSLGREKDQLATENARLAATSADASQAQWASSSEYLPRDKWAEAGLQSPEAAVQTLFRAMRDQDVGRMLSCLSEQGGRALNLRTNPGGDLRPDSSENMHALGETPGFRIEQRETLAEGRIRLGLRARAGGTLLNLKLRQEGEEWKIDGT